MGYVLPPSLYIKHIPSYHCAFIHYTTIDYRGETKNNKSVTTLQMYLHDASSLPTVTDMGFELAPGLHYMVDIQPSTVYNTFLFDIMS